MKLLTRFLFRAYKLTVSPFIHWIAGPGAGCRFEPTCSQYFADAVEVHGFLRGAQLGVRRICRCNPWCEAGYDPVPGKISTPEQPTQLSKI